MEQKPGSIEEREKFKTESGRGRIQRGSTAVNQQRLD
jgi:hypothetical protein